MKAKLGDVIACVTETDSVNYRGLRTLRATLDTPAGVELGQRLIDEEGWFIVEPPAKLTYNGEPV